MTNHWIDIGNSDCILIMGSNAAENHPISFKWVTKAMENGATLISVDPRFTRTSARADMYTALRSGTDIAFLGGRRTAEEQNDLFKGGYSTKDGYTNLSKHQSGQAFDVIPFLRGKVKENLWNYGMICQAILSTADDLGLNIRCGADWNMNGEYLTDQNFQDYGHYEIIN